MARQGSRGTVDEIHALFRAPSHCRRVREMGCAKFGEILKKPRVPSAGEEMLLPTPPRCLKGMIETGKDKFLG